MAKLKNLKVGMLVKVKKSVNMDFESFSCAPDYRGMVGVIADLEDPLTYPGSLTVRLKIGIKDSAWVNHSEVKILKGDLE